MIKRVVSKNEKLYRLLQRRYETFSIQFIVEGVGEIERKELEKAVLESFKYTPFINSLYKDGEWKEKKNISEIVCINEIIDIKNKVFRIKNNVDNESSYNIFIFKNGVVFNVFHGVTDGKGIQLWIENIFRILNKKRALKTNSLENDEEFIKKINFIKRERKLNLDIKIPRDKELIESEFFHITLPYISRNTIYRVAQVITETLKSGKQRFMIPTDIRKYREGVVTTSNLVLPIILEVNEREKIEEIREKFLKSLRGKEELQPVNSRVLNLITNKKFHKILINFLEFLQKNLKRNMGTGTISNLGKVKLEDYSTENFKATKIYSIPVVQPFAPISANIIENNLSTEIVVGIYKGFIGKEKIKGINEGIKNEILGERREIFSEDDILKRIYKNIKEQRDDIVVIQGEKKYTYGDLEKKIVSIMIHLKKKGYVKGKGVIVNLDRGIDYIASIIAINFLGGYFIPIDKESSVKRIEYILEQNKHSFLITDKKNKLNYEKMILIEEIDENEDGKLDIKEFYNEEKRVYVIYTSGTTNAPKGVKILRESLSNYLKWCEEYYKFSKGNTFAFFTSIEVDLSITSYFLPLYTGGKIYIYEEKLDTGVLKKLLSNEEIDFIKLTPTHLRLIKVLGIKSERDIKLIVGGESLSGDLIENIRKNLKNIEIYNEYGPTETTVAVTCFKIEKKKNVEDEVPIGKPIYNTKIILGDGEIYVGGMPVGEGYVDKNEKGYINFFKERFYKTNDIGFKNRDGELVYIGRKGDEIKYLGHRLDINAIVQDIKKAINNIDEIYLKNDKNILKLYLISKNEKIVEEVWEYVKINFSSLKIKEIYWSEDIPISQGGKTEYKKFNRYLKDTKQYEENNKKECSEIIKIIKEILEIDGKEQIDEKSNFFDLGGDSVDYIVLQNEIVKRFKIEKNKEEELFKELGKYYENLSIKNIMNSIRRIKGE